MPGTNVTIPTQNQVIGNLANGSGVTVNKSWWRFWSSLPTQPQQLAADPPNPPYLGYQYFNTGTSKLRYWNGTTWTQF